MKTGEWIEVIDETISGMITALDEETVTFENADGFSFTYSRDEVVLLRELPINERAILRAKKEKKAGIQKKKRSSNKKNTNGKSIEVDLHIEHLIASVKKKSDYELLNLQLSVAREKLEFAIKSHAQRIVFIHGVGKGVLRMELETLFRRYEEVEFYDAEFSQYGRGATEVYIHQNF